MNITYSAPAKIILSGEHAAVYGRPVLIAAIDRRLHFSVWRDEKKIVDKQIQIIADKVKSYLTSKKIRFEEIPFNYKITSVIPIGQNLGSSAALSVAATAALLEFYTGNEFKKDDINSVAYEIEKYFHKNPSGGDNSASCFGGLIYFRKEFEFLKNISALAIKIPSRINESLYIIDSGKSVETTAELVIKVGELYNKEPKKIEEILNQIEKTTKRIVVSITQENINFFKQCIEENERFLEELKVVSSSTKKLLTDLQKFGTGKVTGAGGYKKGSGNILFFADKTKEVEEYLSKSKIRYIKFRQDFEGVRKEK